MTEMLTRMQPFGVFPVCNYQAERPGPSLMP